MHLGVDRMHSEISSPSLETKLMITNFGNIPRSSKPPRRGWSSQVTNTKECSPPSDKWHGIASHSYKAYFEQDSHILVRAK